MSYYRTKCHLRIDFPSDLFPSGFHIRSLERFSSVSYWQHALPISCLCFGYWILFGEDRRKWSSSLRILFSSPFPPTLLSKYLNIFLSTLFSNTLRLRSYLNVKDQVSHPHKYQTQATYFLHCIGKVPVSNFHCTDSFCYFSKRQIQE